MADTHGIVYTPQAIVDFMLASVAEVLETEFGKGLGDPGVNILDPCIGTGNFIFNLLRRIPKKDLPRMYRVELFADEVMTTLPFGKHDDLLEAAATGTADLLDWLVGQQGVRNTRLSRDTSPSYQLYSCSPVMWCCRLSALSSQEATMFF